MEQVITAATQRPFNIGETHRGAACLGKSRALGEVDRYSVQLSAQVQQVGSGRPVECFIGHETTEGVIEYATTQTLNAD